MIQYKGNKFTSFPRGSSGESMFNIFKSIPETRKTETKKRKLSYIENQNRNRTAGLFDPKKKLKRHNSLKNINVMNLRTVNTTGWEKNISNTSVPVNFRLRENKRKLRKTRKNRS